MRYIAAEWRRIGVETPYDPVSRRSSIVFPGRGGQVGSPKRTAHAAIR